MKPDSGILNPDSAAPADSERKIFSAEFARLYQLGTPAAARRYIRSREVPHIQAGRDLFTRPSWVATWEARRVKHLTPEAYTTPRETMLATAAVLVGELERRGLIRVHFPVERAGKINHRGTEDTEGRR